MFANLSDARCYYELIGSGDPVLLVPGLGTTCSLWDCVAAELSHRFSLILLDNRGVGRSVTKRAPHDIRDFAVDLVELMDHLQLERAHVVGISLGGMIAQQLAIDHPSRIDKLVLVSCTNRFGPYLREVARLLAHALRHFKPDLFRRTVELLGTSPQYLDDHADDIEELIARDRFNGIPRRALGRQLRCVARHDTDEQPEFRITAPTLVVGCEQDMLIPACYARRMADEIPGSEFFLVPGCGHNPFTEKPEVMVELVTEFLSRPRAKHERFISGQQQQLSLASSSR
jgi:pimeloyl-ACP methyl ester carboxylesterase